MFTWMAWCELLPRRRHNARKTYSSLWRLTMRSCPNIMSKSLQSLVYFSFQPISFILSRSCNHLGSRTTQRICILRATHLIHPNTRRPFWSMWRMNTTRNINQFPSLNLKMISTATPTPLQTLLDLVNLLLIRMICEAMMTNNDCPNGWRKRLPGAAIMQHADWPPQGSIWNVHLNRQTTGGKYIQMLMITTPTPGRVAVHFGYPISRMGGASRGKHTQSTPIPSMWLGTYSVLCPRLSEWRPVVFLCEMWFGGDSLKPLARQWGKKS